jgi:hypothetical protein
MVPPNDAASASGHAHPPRRSGTCP